MIQTKKTPDPTESSGAIKQEPTYGQANSESLTNNHPLLTPLSCVNAKGKAAVAKARTCSGDCFCQIMTGSGGGRDEITVRDWPREQLIRDLAAVRICMCNCEAAFLEMKDENALPILK